MIVNELAKEVESFRTRLLTSTGIDGVTGLVMNEKTLGTAIDEMDKLGILYKDPYLVGRPHLPTFNMLNGIKIEFSEWMSEHFVAVVGPDRKILAIIDLRAKQ